MALPSNLFNTKRPTEPGSLRHQGPAPAEAVTAPIQLPAHQPGTGIGGNTGPGPGLAGAAAAAPEGSRLTVGPNIKLKGVEITDCDTLVVEGLVEATMDSRVIRIAETGAFKGSADIDFAEIRGSFDGNLTVRQKLVIHATGKVSGTIHYGKLVVEEGGQLSGQIAFGTPAAHAASAKPATAPAARPALVSG